jgi:CRP/FNR family cyclic AMP-dependent transcriptional regulator
MPAWRIPTLPALRAALEGFDVATMVSLLQTGKIFGEIALLDGRPRTADAVALSDCELIVIERRDFLALLHSEPKVGMKLIELLCARLRLTSRPATVRFCHRAPARASI